MQHFSRDIGKRVNIKWFIWTLWNCSTCGCQTLQCIGRVSLARENEAGRSWGQKVHILHVNVYDFVLFLVVIIELFQSNNFSYTVRKIITSKSSGTLYR